MLHYDEALLEGLPGPEERMAAYHELLTVVPGFKEEKYQFTPPTWPELWAMAGGRIMWAQMYAAECIEDEHWVLNNCRAMTGDDGDQPCEGCAEEVRQIEQARTTAFDMWDALVDLKETWPPEPGRYKEPIREEDGIPF